MFKKLLYIVINICHFRADSLTRIIYWPEPYQCTGKEPRLAHCDLRMNGQIYGHKYGCNWEGKSFVFLHCGKENLDQGKKNLQKIFRFNFGNTSNLLILGSLLNILSDRLLDFGLSLKQYKYTKVSNQPVLF